MKMRGVRWQFIYALLVVVGVAAVTMAAGPVYQHEPTVHEEFKILYNEKADVDKTPKISSGSGAPSDTSKIGDIYVDTDSATIYVSTAANSTSWVAVN